MTWLGVKVGAAGAAVLSPPSNVKRPFLGPDVAGRHCFAAVILDVLLLLVPAPAVLLPLAVDADDEGYAVREPLALAAGCVPVPGRGAIGRGSRGRRRPDADDEVVDCGLPFELATLAVECGDGPPKGGDGVWAEMVKRVAV